MRRGYKNAAGRAAAAVRRMLPRVLALALAVLLVFACAASAFAKSGDGDTVTEPITTIGADSPTGSDSASTGEQSATMDGSENTNTEDGETDPEVERRKEIYTFMTLIGLGAIIVGIREKKNKRKF